MVETPGGKQTPGSKASKKYTSKGDAGVLVPADGGVDFELVVCCLDSCLDTASAEVRSDDWQA